MAVGAAVGLRAGLAALALAPSPVAAVPTLLGLPLAPLAAGIALAIVLAARRSPACSADPARSGVGRPIRCG